MTRRAAAWPAALLLLAACSTSGPAPLRSPSQSLAADQSLRVGVPGPIADLDPALAAGESDLAAVRQFAEPLLKPAPDLQDVQPATAASYELSADGTVALFHLRPNARYGDGVPVRAADLVFAWTRIIDPRTASPLAPRFAEVVRGGAAAAALDPQRDEGRLGPALAGLGLKAIDDLSFQVTAPGPSAQLKWVATLPQGAPLRQALLQQMGPGWASRPEGLVGNGPFTVAAIRAPDRVDLVPNSAYWGGRPTLRRIAIEHLADDASTLREYQADRLDIGVLDSAPAPAPAPVLRQPLLSEVWLTFNTAAPPFDNPRVRRAFAEAIDRQAVIRTALDGRGQAAAGLVPQGMRGHRADLVHAQEFNAGQARADLDAAGAARDLPAAVRLLTTDRAGDRRLAEAVATQLRDSLGLPVSVEVADAATADGRLRSGDFQLAAPLGATAAYPDPEQLLGLFRQADPGNLSRWHNPRYDRLLRQAAAETDPGRRDQLWAQAQLILVQETPVAFLAQRQRWYLVRPAVRGLAATAVDEWPGALYSAQMYLNARS